MGAGLALRGAASLHKRVSALRIDGADVSVPVGTKSILVLNIPSYGAGTHPWGDDGAAIACVPPAHHTRSFAPAAVDDGQLEVVALFGIIHAATLHNPLSWRAARGGGAKRLGQGGAVEIIFRDADALTAAAGVKALRRRELAAQSDGEAWSFDSIGESVTLSLAGRVGAPLGPQHRRGGAFPSVRATLHAAGEETEALACVVAGEVRAEGKEVAGVRREPYV
jgi:hypothetical protein